MADRARDERQVVHVDVIAGLDRDGRDPDHLAVLAHLRPRGQVPQGDLVAGGHGGADHHTRRRTARDDVARAEITEGDRHVVAIAQNEYVSHAAPPALPLSRLWPVTHPRLVTQLWPVTHPWPVTQPWPATQLWPVPHLCRWRQP